VKEVKYQETEYPDEYSYDKGLACGNFALEEVLVWYPHLTDSDSLAAARLGALLE
jgi:hypothetical protein